MGIEGFASAETSHVLSEDGFGIFMHGTPSQQSPCIAFVFKTGEVWGIDAYHLGMDTVIPLIEPYFINALENYAAVLREQLGVPPPYQWIAGIEGVKGRAIEVPRHAPGQLLIEGEQGACMSDAVVIKGTHGEGGNSQMSLRSFFVEVYDSCNVRRPDWMDDFRWPST